MPKGGTTGEKVGFSRWHWLHRSFSQVVTRVGNWEKSWNTPEVGILAFLALLAILLLQRQNLMLDPDTGWLIRSGQLIWQQGRFPTGDVFSFTHQGQPWVLYQWGFELYLAGLHYLAGLGGVIWGTALIIALTYALILAYLLRTGLNPLWSIGLVVLAALTNQFCWYSRPGTFSILAYTLLLLKLEGYRRDPKSRLWDLPVLFLLWANIHLGFIMGLGVLGLYGLWAWVAPSALAGDQGSRDYRLLRIFPFCLGAACLNPYGLHLLVYFFHLMRAPAMNRAIIELRSPDFHLPTLAFFLGEIILLLWAGPGGYPGRSLLLTLVSVTLVLSLLAVRLIPFFAVAATLHLALSLKSLGYQVQPHWGRLTKKWIGAAVLGIVVSGVWVGVAEHNWPGFYTFDDRLVPKGAVAFLAGQPQQLPPLKVFVQDAQWASYVLYRLYPRVRVFIDSRFDMYGDRSFALFLFLQKQAVIKPDILRRWGVDWLVLQKTRLTGIPPVRPSWHLVYEDGQSLIYQYRPKTQDSTEPYNPYK